MQFFRRTRWRDSAEALYDIIVDQSRKPEFYVLWKATRTVASLRWPTYASVESTTLHSEASLSSEA